MHVWIPFSLQEYSGTHHISVSSYEHSFYNDLCEQNTSCLGFTRQSNFNFHRQSNQLFNFHHQFIYKLRSKIG